MVKWALFGLTALLLGSGEAWAKAPSAYTVGKVYVATEAQDAVVAKQNALLQAQQDALRVLLKRLTNWRSHTRLPVLEDTMVDRMVDGFSVRQESNSATRYVATLDFTFEPNAVNDVLNRFGVPYTNQQAPQVLLLPVMLEAGGLRAGSDNVWYAALAGTDYEHSLAPLKLAPPRAELTPSMIAGLGNNSRELFETMKYQYRTENIVLAVAEFDAQASQLQLRLAGQDAVGSFSLSRTFHVTDGDKDQAAKFVAAVSVRIIENRWKTTRLASRGVDGDETVAVESIALTAQFAGLKQWQDMRGRLQKVPGVQGLDIKALNARAASLTLDYPGGVNGLSRAVQAQGLAVQQMGGEWVLVIR